MLEEEQGAVRPNSQVLEESVTGTKQLTVVVVAIEPTGMHYFLNYILDRFCSLLILSQLIAKCSSFIS